MHVVGDHAERARSTPTLCASVQNRRGRLVRHGFRCQAVNNGGLKSRSYFAASRPLDCYRIYDRNRCGDSHVLNRVIGLGHAFDDYAR